MLPPSDASFADASAVIDALSNLDDCQSIRKASLMDDFLQYLEKL